MTKEELAQVLQRELGETTFEEARDLVEAVFDQIATELARGKKVRMDGFGVFEAYQQKERVTYRHPTDENGKIIPGPKGEKVVLPPRWTARFRCSRRLRGLLNS